MKQKQSQKNIQIVKVQVGDVKKKRKAKRKTKGKKRSEVFSGTGLAPVLGQTQYFTPPMFPTSRMGTQFEPPKIQVADKKEDPLKDALKDAEMSLEILKKLQETTKGKEYGTKVPFWADRPSPFNVPSPSGLPTPLEAGYWDPYQGQWQGTDTPPRPIDRPQQPLVASEAASSSSVLYKPSRQYLRSLSLDELNQLAKSLDRGSGKATSKEQLIEILVGYRPPF